MAVPWAPLLPAWFGCVRELAVAWNFASPAKTHFPSPFLPLPQICNSKLAPGVPLVNPRSINPPAAVDGRRRAGVNPDEENAAVLAYADAASWGARKAVIEAHAAAAGQQAPARAAAAAPAGAVGAGAAPAVALVGGVLPVPDAANAAAEGAANAVRALVRLQPQAYPLTASEMRQVQAASSAGAATGVIAAAFMAIMGGPAAVIPPADVNAQPEVNPESMRHRNQK